jgi:oligopeptide transport system substrate-binding protein
MPSHLSPTAFPNSPDSYAGSGPFWFGHWERGKQIVLYKNPHYWDAHSVRLPRIQIQILNYPYLILDLFQKEKLDWVSPMLTSLPTSSLTKYEGKGCLSSYPIAGTVFIAYNSERFPFQNVNFRKSLSFSIDRRSVVGSVTQMGECPASRLIPPVLDPSAGPVSFDPVAARCRLGKALVELGISQMRDGDLCGIDAINRLLSSNLTFSFSNDSGKSHQVVAHALIRHWKGVLGLNIEPEPLSFREQMDRIGKGDFGMTLIFSAAHLNDPMNLLERFKHKHLDRNFPRYESPEFISLLDHANRTLDSKERNRLLQMAELHLLESCPISPIYHVNYPVLSRNSVDGVEITPIGSVHFNRARVDCCDAPPNEAAVI